MNNSSGLIAKLFRDPTDQTSIQLLRYSIVGGTAFVADFFSLYALTEIFGVHYLRSAAASFLLGLGINYSLSIVWVFDEHTYDNRWVEFTVFGLIGAAGLALNEVIIWSITEFANQHYLFSKLVATAVVFGWNFVVRKYFLFGRASAA